MSGRDRFPLWTALFWLAAPLVWFIHFSSIYGGMAFGAARGVTPAALEAFAWGATFVAAAAILVILAVGRYRRPAGAPADRVVGDMSRLLALLSLTAVLLQALPLLLVAA